MASARVLQFRLAGDNELLTKFTLRTTFNLSVGGEDFAPLMDTEWHQQKKSSSRLSKSQGPKIVVHFLRGNEGLGEALESYSAKKNVAVVLVETGNGYNISSYPLPKGKGRSNKCCFLMTLPNDHRVGSTDAQVLYRVIGDAFSSVLVPSAKSLAVETHSVMIYTSRAFDLVGRGHLFFKKWSDIAFSLQDERNVGRAEQAQVNLMDFQEKNQAQLLSQGGTKSGGLILICSPDAIPERDMRSAMYNQFVCELNRLRAQSQKIVWLRFRMAGEDEVAGLGNVQKLGDFFSEDCMWSAKKDKYKQEFLNIPTMTIVLSPKQSFSKEKLMARILHYGGVEPLVEPEVPIIGAKVMCREEHQAEQETAAELASLLHPGDTDDQRYVSFDGQLVEARVSHREGGDVLTQLIFYVVSSVELLSNQWHQEAITDLNNNAQPLVVIVYNKEAPLVERSTLQDIQSDVEFLKACDEQSRIRVIEFKRGEQHPRHVMLSDILNHPRTQSALLEMFAVDSMPGKVTRRRSTLPDEKNVVLGDMLSDWEQECGISSGGAFTRSGPTLLAASVESGAETKARAKTRVDEMSTGPR